MPIPRVVTVQFSPVPASCRRLCYLRDQLCYRHLDVQFDQEEQRMELDVSEAKTVSSMSTKGEAGSTYIKPLGRDMTPIMMPSSDTETTTMATLTLKRALYFMSPLAISSEWMSHMK
jgi:hypothetical protein